LVTTGRDSIEFGAIAGGKKNDSRETFLEEAKGVREFLGREGEFFSLFHRRS
jgi:hypothetical protein